MSDTSVWDRLEKVLQTHAPSLLAALNPPASPAELQDAENAFGIALPDEIRTAYLRHNGTIGTRGTEGSSGLIFGPLCSWGCLSEVIEIWRGRWRGADDLRSGEDGQYAFPDYEPYWDKLKVRPWWFCKEWIPIGVSSTASCIHVDLSPAPMGKVGQLLEDHGMGDARVIADSFNAYLELCMDHLVSGRLRFDHGWIDARTGTWTYAWKDFGR